MKCDLSTSTTYMLPCLEQCVTGIAIVQSLLYTAANRHSVWAMMTLLKIRATVVTTVLCCIVYHVCTVMHTHMSSRIMFSLLRFCSF